jgi:fucose permease
MITTIILIIIYLSFIGLGLPDALLGAAWPSMYTSLNLPLSHAGYIAIIISAGSIISSICSTHIIARFGTGVVTAVSTLMTAVGLIGFSLSGSFGALCFCAIPAGLGAGAVDSALNNYTAIHYKAQHMSWLHCFWGIGASLGPIVMSAFLISKGSWAMGYRAIGLIQLSLAAILFLSLPLWKSKSIQEPPVAHQTIKFKQIFRIRGLKEVLIGFFCYVGIEAVASLWGASYLVIVKKISPETAAQWLALFYVGITFGRFVSGFITMALLNRQMVRLGQIGIAIGIIVLLLPLGHTALLAGFFIIGFGCAPIFPSLIHETPKSFGARYSQSIMGMQMASTYISATLFPPLFGQIATFTGFGIFPISLAIILIINIIALETLNKIVDRREMKIHSRH